tara:strand:- start:1893 stop:2531 length:639 start_codon:yes stop_codon:yes gene_type:complete
MKLKGKAKQRARAKLLKAKQQMLNNDPATLLESGPDWTAINNRSQSIQEFDLLWNILDEQPQKAYSIFAGTVSDCLANIEYLHQSADKGINTHMRENVVSNPVTGEELFKVADMFIDNRGTSIEQTRTLFKNYLSDWVAGEAVIKPAVKMSLNGMEYLMNYYTRVDGISLCIQIGKIKTPGGAIKTNIKTLIESVADYDRWAHPADADMEVA